MLEAVKDFEFAIDSWDDSNKRCINIVDISNEKVWVTIVVDSDEHFNLIELFGNRSFCKEGWNDA